MTVAEFKASPTHGIDWTSLVPGGSDAENDASLAIVLDAASAWVNDLCEQPTLAATTDTETVESHVNRDGRILVWPTQYPIRNVSNVQFKVHPAVGWTPISDSFVQVYERFFECRTIGIYGVSSELVQRLPPLNYNTPYQMANIARVPIILQYTYINGWPVTTLASPADVGDKSIALDDPTGIVANMKLTLYDDGSTETVLVASSYTSGTTIPLVNALRFSHAAGIGASSLPAPIKQATILLAASLIRQRGSQAITPSGTPSMIGGSPYDRTDIDTVTMLLRPYRRTVVK